MHTVKNKKRRQRAINLPGKTLYLPPRGKALLTDKEFQCVEIQQLLLGGYISEVGGER